MANLDLDVLKKEYDELIERETIIDDELQLLLNNQSINNSKFNSIKSIYLNVQLICKDSQNLSNMVNFTSNLADNVSHKVRQLDLAKGRVSNCIKRVTDILDLKACTDGVTEALNEENYETAANHIHRYLRLDKESLRLKSEVEVDLNENTYLDQSFSLLQESKAKLQHIVNEKYNLALSCNDVPQLERFFKIFPLIGLSQEGLEKFSKYLCNQITVSAEKNYSLILNLDKSDKRWNIVFADALIMLFEKVARIIEAYQPLIQNYYGKGHIFLFLKNIQNECDLQSNKILSSFKQTRNLDQILRLLQQQSFYGSNASQISSQEHISSSNTVINNNSNNVSNISNKIDPRDLDELLTEITMISARSELYKSFIIKSVMNDLETFNNKNEELKTIEIEKFVNLSGLELSIQELIGKYSQMENYFMTENIFKAIKMDSINELTSSVVDDTFFIIKKCLKRCLSSDNVDACCAMFNNSITILESQYRDYLYSKLKSGFPPNSGFVDFARRQLAQTNTTEQQKVEFLITLNNIEWSIECINAMKKVFENDCFKLFANVNQSSKDKLSMCLNELNLVATHFKELLDFGFNQLNSNEIKPKLKQSTESYLNINHKINEDDLNQFSISDPFIEQYIKNIDQMILSLKSYLSPKNQEQLANLISTETANLLEKNVLKCSFTKYGGLQLDKEIRVLINYLTSLTSWSIREKFSRLTQISILLSLENIDELFEYWNSSLAITWRLTPNEIRQILMLRTDLKSNEIKALKL